jgi:excisionase family DNA binding protein
MEGSPRLMAVNEVAALLGLSEYQVRAEHRRGILPARRAGRFLRFTEADLEAYLTRIAEDLAGAQSGQTAGSRAASQKPR